MKIKLNQPETFTAHYYDGTEEHANKLSKKGVGFCHHDEMGFIDFTFTFVNEGVSYSLPAYNKECYFVEEKMMTYSPKEFYNKFSEINE